MKLNSPDLCNALAAEYVLGTLRGRARRRFERQMLLDRDLFDTVGRWENHLTPLIEGIAPVEPPARVWRAIEARIDLRSPGSKSLVWWESLTLWRNLTLATSAVAAALLIAFISLRPAAPETSMIAVLSTPESVARMVIEQQSAGELTVRVVAPWAAMPDKSLELWVIPKGGAPRSLGLVAHDRDSLVRLSNLDSKLVDGTAFAISKEPKGGSTTGAPTGPVLCSGAIARVGAVVKT